MPYIKPELRPAVDKLAKPIVDLLLSYPVEQREGVLNYTITRILKETYTPSYANYAKAIGMLETCKLEYYRHIIGPYEDGAIQRNGDLD